ncbi:MAG TPA: ABC transporter permease [Flavisolibacter sp.]|nr:ABC transporter permease [Flavisolibacter sp.]
MFRNYMKIAFRSMWKQKSFSLINLLGLASGLCCFLLISMYVLDELSYDRFYKHADRIYRINADIKFGGNDLHLPQTSDMMGPTLKKDYPQVEQFARVYTNTGSKLVKKGTEFITESRLAHVDSTFFSVFSVPAIAGDLATALNEPNTVVISESAARKYFGTTDALGKTLETNDNTLTAYKVTGVVKDLPQNSHFRFDFYFSMKNINYYWGQFLSHNFNTYLVLKEGTDYKAFQKNFVQYIDKYAIPEAKAFMNITNIAEFEKSGNKLEYSLIPLTDIHLHSDRAFEISPSGNIQYVYIFSAVALFILLIACINFMNLTTAKSANRAKEVGIRKVLGTERKGLITQFLTESTLMVVLSMAIALGLAYFILPLFNTIANKQMHLSVLFSPLLLPLLIALPFLVGLLAGSYPAFYLSGFRPIEVLKGKIKMGNRTVSLRSLLVVVQFATSIILIIGTIVIYRQLNYIQNKNLGYSKDQVLIVDDTYALQQNAAAFKNEVTRLPGVISGTLSAFLPVSNSSRNDNSFSKDAVMNASNGFGMQTWTIDYDYLNTMGMQLVKGRNFSKDYGTDSSAIIINERLASILGYADPIGKKIYSSEGGPNHDAGLTIIGVVKNFNFESLRKDVGPLAFFLGSSTGLASFKVKAEQVPALLKSIESKWKEMAPSLPFSYRFLDESFNEMYRSEQRAGKIALIFSVLAILIACLGLFGLAAFIAEQRTKEIGIRKVLGASVQGIVQLLSKDFVRLVLLSFLIASPLAWYAMHKWLEDFAFRVDINWWIFALAGCIALGIALFTISFQAIRSALANPIKNLRTE